QRRLDSPLSPGADDDGASTVLLQHIIHDAELTVLERSCSICLLIGRARHAGNLAENHLEVDDLAVHCRSGNDSKGCLAGASQAGQNYGSIRIIGRLSIDRKPANHRYRGWKVYGM